MPAFHHTLFGGVPGAHIPSPGGLASRNAGKGYVNVRTAANPGGEIRGQVGIRP